MPDQSNLFIRASETPWPSLFHGRAALVVWRRWTYPENLSLPPAIASSFGLASLPPLGPFLFSLFAAGSFSSYPPRVPPRDGYSSHSRTSSQSGNVAARSSNLLRRSSLEYRRGRGLLVLALAASRRRAVRSFHLRGMRLKGPFVELG